jgi:hypothetical protein
LKCDITNWHENMWNLIFGIIVYILVVYVKKICNNSNIYIIWLIYVSQVTDTLIQKYIIIIVGGISIVITDSKSNGNSEEKVIIM